MRYLKLIIIGALLLLTGCFALPVEDPPLPPPIAQQAEARVLRTVPVTRGDVIRDTSLTANYVPARENRLTFTIAGLRFRGVYVASGDFVYEGEIIASLYWPEIESRLEATARQKEWLELSLSQLERRHQLARRQGTADNAHYRAERARILGELDLIESELDFLNRENERRYLRATMDGTVSRVLFFNEEMVSSTTMVVAVIVDQTYSVFAARVTTFEEHMWVGRYLEMTIGEEIYTVVIIDPDEYGIQREAGFLAESYFIIVDDAPVFAGRVTGSIDVILDISEDALYLPARAVHFASDRVFVYVIDDETGIRVLRDVEVGIRGNQTYEIISGLEEGELVVV